jgi:23S rRNA pseudouridine1911/1915/1917 synthase
MSPYVLEETGAYAVVYKPPGMHSVPLGQGDAPGENTLLGWYARLFPAVLALEGRNSHEGGILHRLDYGTQGLVLFAKTQAAMDALMTQQEKGLFVKEYGALSAGKTPALPPGFPAFPLWRPTETRREGPPSGGGKPEAGEFGARGSGFPGRSVFPESVPPVIESAFRPYGPGRRAVRPVLSGIKGKQGIALDRGRAYRTEVAGQSAAAGRMYFHLRLTRGFRHQIRCHLAWIGYPIINDPLYGGVIMENVPDTMGFALRAQALSFYDPLTGLPRSYAVEPLNPAWGLR